MPDSLEPRVTWRRRLWQGLQQGLTLGHWPASLAHALGMQGPVAVTREHFALLGEASTVPPLRVAFASDFHAGPCTHPSVLDAACRELASLDAPVLLFGGDFVCLSSRAMAALASRLAELPAALGKFAVLGNHDYWAGAAPIVRALEAAGIRVLINESVRLPAPFDQVWICGLDDPIAGHPDPGRMLAPAQGRRIVLMHAPSGLGALGEARFDLALCGHTHGGQVALPGPKPLYVPESPEFRRYSAGRFTLDHGHSLFVTRGVGYSTAPLRTCCPSEVAAFELEFVASAVGHASPPHAARQVCSRVRPSRRSDCQIFFGLRRGFHDENRAGRAL